MKGPVASAASLRRNAVWTLAGNGVYAACQLGMLTILAKAGSPAQVGLFSVSLAVSAPIVGLCLLQLRAVQATDAEDRNRFGDYLGLRLISMVVALAVIAVVAAVGYDRTTATCIVAVGLAKSIEAISDVGFGLLQRHERMRRIAISQMAKGLLSLVAIGGALRLTGSVAWCGAGLALVWTLTLLLIDLPGVLALRPVIGPIEPTLELRRLLPLVWTALPLGVVAAMLLLVNALPRLALERSHGLADVGVFASMVTLTMPGTLVVVALGQTISPRLAAAYVRGDRAAVRRLLRWMFLAAGVVALGGVGVALVAGEPALRLLYSDQIARAGTQLPLIMIGGGLWCMTSVLGYAATAAKRLRRQPLATAVSVLATALAAWWLVPAHGLHGAAICTVVSGAAILPAYVAVMLAREDEPSARPERHGTGG